MNSLNILIHADSGHGKSWLAATAPGPILYIDVEGRSDYIRGNKVKWDPKKDIPAESDNADIITVVDLQKYQAMELVMQWLSSGKHPFKSVVIDSITELQERMMDSLVGAELPQQEHWGALLREMKRLIIRLKDLRRHPKNPILALVLVTGTQEKNNKQRALLQGQLATKIAYLVDVIGYLVRSVTDGTEIRKLYIKPYGPYEAKDNTDILSRHYGAVIDDPNISEMVRVLNQQTEKEETNGNV